MIKNKQQYRYYLEKDKEARGINSSLVSRKFKQIIYEDPTWKFQKSLRKVEFYYNKKKNIVEHIYYYWLEYRFKKLSIRLGFSIPKNAFGPGLSIPHYGSIIVNSKAKIGKNCKIHCGVNIGASGGNPEAPKIGDNVYLGPGSKIYGNIVIGNNIAVAANACVSNSFTEENILIGGIPAKKIKNIDISQIIKHLKIEN